MILGCTCKYEYIEDARPDAQSHVTPNLCITDDFTEDWGTSIAGGISNGKIACQHSAVTLHIRRLRQVCMYEQELAVCIGKSCPVPGSIVWNTIPTACRIDDSIASSLGSTIYHLSKPNKAIFGSQYAIVPI